MNVSIANLYLKPAVGTTDQRLAVTGSVVSFSAFDEDTEYVMLQVQDAAVFATFDGSSPTTSNGFYLAQNTSYNWTRSMATKAKFISAGTAAIHAQECRGL